MARRHSAAMLVLIGAFKLVKSATLIAAGIALISLASDHHATSTLAHWAHALHLDPGARLLRHGIAEVAGLDPRDRALIGGALFLYAAVFLVEGTGLVLRKPWAEWMTLIVTASLIPIEVYEIAREVSIARVVVLIANIAIVAYLVWRLHDERHAV